MSFGMANMYASRPLKPRLQPRALQYARTTPPAAAGPTAQPADQQGGLPTQPDRVEELPRPADRVEELGDESPRRKRAVMPMRSGQQVPPPVSLSIGELKKKAYEGYNVNWQGRYLQPHAKDVLQITRHRRVQQPDHGAADRRWARASLDAPYGGGYLLDRDSEQPHGHGSAAGWSPPSGSGSSSEEDPESGAWTPPTTSDNSSYRVKPDPQAPRTSLASRKHLDKSAYPQPGARVKLWVDFDDLIATPRWEIGTVTRITGPAQNQWYQVRLHMDSRGRPRTVFIRLREHPLWYRWATLVHRRRRPTPPVPSYTANSVVYIDRPTGRGYTTPTRSSGTLAASTNSAPGDSANGDSSGSSDTEHDGRTTGDDRDADADTEAGPMRGRAEDQVGPLTTKPALPSQVSGAMATLQVDDAAASSGASPPTGGLAHDAPAGAGCGNGAPDAGSTTDPEQPQFEAQAGSPSPQPMLSSRISGDMAALCVGTTALSGNPTSPAGPPLEAIVGAPGIARIARALTITSMPLAGSRYPAVDARTTTVPPTAITPGDVIEVVVPLAEHDTSERVIGIVTSSSIDVYQSDGSVLAQVSIISQPGGQPHTVGVGLRNVSMTEPRQWRWESKMTDLGTDTEAVLPDWLLSAHTEARRRLYRAATARVWPHNEAGHDDQGESPGAGVGPKPNLAGTDRNANAPVPTDTDRNANAPVPTAEHQEMVMSTIAGLACAQQPDCDEANNVPEEEDMPDLVHIDGLNAVPPKPPGFARAVQQAVSQIDFIQLCARVPTAEEIKQATALLNMYDDIDNNTVAEIVFGVMTGDTGSISATTAGMEVCGDNNTMLLQRCDGNGRDAGSAEGTAGLESGCVDVADMVDVNSGGISAGVGRARDNAADGSSINSGYDPGGNGGSENTRASGGNSNGKTARPSDGNTDGHIGSATNLRTPCPASDCDGCDDAVQRQFAAALGRGTQRHGTSAGPGSTHTITATTSGLSTAVHGPADGVTVDRSPNNSGTFQGPADPSGVGDGVGDNNITGPGSAAGSNSGAGGPTNNMTDLDDDNDGDVGDGSTGSSSSATSSSGLTSAAHGPADGVTVDRSPNNSGTFQGPADPNGVGDGAGNDVNTESSSAAGSNSGAGGPTNNMTDLVNDNGGAVGITAVDGTAPPQGVPAGGGTPPNNVAGPGGGTPAPDGGTGGSNNGYFGAGRTAATAGPRFVCTGASDCAGCNSDAGQRFAAALGGRSTTTNGPALASCLRVPPEQATSARNAPNDAGPPPPAGTCAPDCKHCPGNRTSLATHPKARGPWIVDGCPYPECSKHCATFGDVAAYRQHLSRCHGMTFAEAPWFEDLCQGPDSTRPALRTCEHCYLPFRAIHGHRDNCVVKRAKEQRARDPACNEPNWRAAAFSAAAYRVSHQGLLHSRDYAWSDIALLRRSMASPAETRTAERMVKHINTAVIDAIRIGAGDLFSVHPDSCEATMIEDCTKLLVLLSLQVQLQDEGNCYEQHPFIDNTLGDAVPTIDQELPAHRSSGAGPVITRVLGFLRCEWYAVDFAIQQLRNDLLEAREAAESGAEVQAPTTTSTPGHNGVVPERTQRTEDSDASRRQRVENAISKGEIGRARKTLMTNGSRALPTAAKIAALRSKFKPQARQDRGTSNRKDHPDNARHPANVPARWEIPNKTTAPEASTTVVRKALRSISRVVGTGIDGVGRQHLETMMHLDDITILMNLTMNGGLPPGAVRSLAGGAVIMIAKPKSPDDIRPIVPQSLLIRLPGKLLLAMHGLRVNRAMDPWQAAVGVPAGCETISSIFAQAIYRDHDAVGIVSDKKNGYGESKRDELLRWFCNELPYFARFILMVYGDYLTLTFVDDHGDKAQIEVWDGMLQGDVLAGLGFTGVGSKGAKDAMAKVAKKMTTLGQDIKQHRLIGHLMRYVDDRVDLTTAQHLEWYLREVLIPNWEEDDRNGQFIGTNDLTVIAYENPDGAPMHEAEELRPLREYVERRVALGFPLVIQYVNLLAEDAEGKVGLDLLGVPIGTPACVEAALNKRMGKVRAELEAIETLPTQGRMLVLRFCVTAELNYWCRSLTPMQNLEAIVDIERRIARLLRRAMQQPVQEEAIEALPEEYFELMFKDELDANTITRRWSEDNTSFRDAVTRALLSLPISRGGAGIGSALVTRVHAFVAAKMDVLNSPLGALTHYGKELQAQGRTPPVMGPRVFDELEYNIPQLWEHCGHVADKSDNPVPTSIHEMLRQHGESRFTSRRGASYQGRLANLVLAVAQARVKRVVHMADTYSAAKMELRSMPGALACLSATGQDAGTKLTDDEMGHLLSDIGCIEQAGTTPGPDGQIPPCPDCKTNDPVDARHAMVCGTNGDVTRTHTAIARLLAEACVQCGVEFDRLRGMEPWVGKIPEGSDKYADLEYRHRGKTYLADVHQIAVKIGDPVALQAAARDPASVLAIGDKAKMNQYRNVVQQTPGVITPLTINPETGAFGQDLSKLFIVLRQLTTEDGPAFGKVTTGDLRVAELGSWLQPTKGDYYLQRLSVLLRKRMTAKVRGIVQRARDALLGGPNGTFDEGFEGDDDRVERMGDMLANIIR